MTKWYSTILLLLLSYSVYAQNIQILDSTTKVSIPFATISFGNGLGTFANDDGYFSFSKKKYADVDTLYISSLGYTQKIILANELPEKVYLQQEISQLSEVVLSAPKRGKFKNRKRKAITHTDIFTSWLPTVESEVAVFFERYEGKSTQISTLLLPINAETKYKSKGKGKFATICRIQFYTNKNGLPSDPIGHENIIFAIGDKEDKVFKLDIASKAIFIPKDGIYASLQVLGYANKQGKLVASKKYREIKTPKGIRKVSTSFRPLLPFVKKTDQRNTYVRRIFLNNKKWQIFDKSYNENSKLIQTGHRNYAMGALFKVYEN